MGIATQNEIAQEALSRATGNMSTMNYGPIFEGFIKKGIPEDQIRPRENVFTFNAWRALGKCVKKGEHGVQVCTWIKRSKEVVKDGKAEIKEYAFPKTSYVFHISQVKELS